MDRFYMTNHGERFIRAKLARLRALRRRLFARNRVHVSYDFINTLRRIEKDARHFRKLELLYKRCWRSAHPHVPSYDNFFNEQRKRLIKSKLTRLVVMRRRLLSRYTDHSTSIFRSRLKHIERECRHFRKLILQYRRQREPFSHNTRYVDPQCGRNAYGDTDYHMSHAPLHTLLAQGRQAVNQSRNVISSVDRASHHLHQPEHRCTTTPDRENLHCAANSIRQTFSSNFRPQVHFRQRTNALDLVDNSAETEMPHQATTIRSPYPRHNNHFQHPSSSRNIQNHVPHQSRHDNFPQHTRLHMETTHRESVYQGVANTFVSRRRNITERLFFGPRTETCPDCGARMWLEEKVKDSPRYRPRFNLCCQSGQVKLPLLPTIPDYLKGLLHSRRFRDRIRLYNASLKFTSTGGKIDYSVLEGRGPYVYRISGENCHRIGSLLPPPEKPPKFAQLYIYDTEHETTNRMAIFQRNLRSSRSSLRPSRSVLQGLRDMLGRTNPYVQVFQAARDIIREDHQRDLHIRLLKSRNGRQYTMPTSNEVAALIVGDGTEFVGNRDIIVRKLDGTLQRIYETHPSYMPLQYPLIFPYGTDGWSPDIPLAPGSHKGKRVNISMREFFAFRMQNRPEEETSVNDFGRLSQQYHVDSYAAVEADRLFYYKTHQSELRADVYSGLQDAVEAGDTDASVVGRKFILPSSFTGGPRNMIQHYQDAIAICRAKGYPDLFITFTCNPRWPEILSELSHYPDQNVEDVSKIVARAFKNRIRCLMADLKKSSFLGETIADMYVVEFQKRGLPHIHIILTLSPRDKLEMPEHIDDIISTEIPDEDTDPLAFETVMRCMIHGPCGAANPSSPCMVNGKCSKNYPKKFNDHTVVDERGYVTYRRRNTGKTWKVNGVDVDNRWVVPYNRDLLVRYDAHINVERCVPGKLIRYLYLYLMKGSDRATAQVVDNTEQGGNRQQNPRQQNPRQQNPHHRRDEIKQYLDCRYVSAIEACWRLLEFNLQKQNPSVIRLQYHLEGEQNVVFQGRGDVSDVVQREGINETMFTMWFQANIDYPEANALTYVEMPQFFVWDKSIKRWRIRAQRPAVGRMFFAHPSCGERYFLRLLLTKVRGPKSYADIRTVDGIEYPTYKAACIARGLLHDDDEWDEALTEASHWASGAQLRNMFCRMLLFNVVAHPEALWLTHWVEMTDDFTNRIRRQTGDYNLVLSGSELQNLGLLEMEKILKKNGKSLSSFPHMPLPSEIDALFSTDRLLREARDFNREEEVRRYMSLHTNLNADQLRVFDTIMQASAANEGGLYFVYGSGGTGKTYLWNTLISRFRSEGKIVLSVASSGIASLLLPGGRTAHSLFKIPFSLHSKSCCPIDPREDVAILIQHAALIIWDEAPMLSRYAFEAVDRTFRDILKHLPSYSNDKPFGGKLMVLGGDFRQILPVITHGGRAETVGASLPLSPLWRFCHVLHLRHNMRVTSTNVSPTIRHELATFANWLLDVGEGKIPTMSLGAGLENDWIKIPDEYLIDDREGALQELIDATYPDLHNNYNDLSYLNDRAILAPTNKDVDELNSFMLSMFPGEMRAYYSADTLDASDNCDMHPPELFHSMDLPGLPSHRLELKVGVPVVLLRNIDHSMGLCNGTRLIISKMGDRVLEAKVVTGSGIGETVVISRLRLTPTTDKVPFLMARTQFPIKVAFAMTINKSQGQTIKNVGIYLPKPVFSHGQLYVALSRVTSPSALKILITDNDQVPKGYTKNVVYSEIFTNIQ